MANFQTAYAAYPSAVIYEEAVPGKTEGKKALQHLIWGDWLQVKTPAGEWRQVRSRGVDGVMHESAIQTERLLEVNFVDIGQGDGSLVVTPDDRRLVIDAGAATTCSASCAGASANSPNRCASTPP
ncbi:MAG: hypothetical protein HC897_07590 [Thermoanaerobaculia bacterium]|nr:hypothetical protein [Thermoanaerobaculia bacterium]